MVYLDLEEHLRHLALVFEEGKSKIEAEQVSHSKTGDTVSGHIISKYDVSPDP